MRGAERRQALVRITPHPVTRLAVGSISGSPEMTGQWRRPARLSTPCCGVLLTASGRAFCGDLSLRRQPAPGRGSLCPRAEPRRCPGARRTRPERAGAAPVRGPELPGAGCRKSPPVLRRRLIRLAPSSERHRLTPLSEQDARIIRPCRRPGI